MAARKKSQLTRATSEPTPGELERIRASLKSWKPTQSATTQALNSLSQDIKTMLERGASTTEVVAQLAGLGITLHAFRQWRKATDAKAGGAV